MIRNRSEKTRSALRIKKNCAYCDAVLSYEDYGANYATLDHIIPKSRGGDDFDSNLTLCCLSCNRSKSNMTVEKFIIWAGADLIVHAPTFTLEDLKPPANDSEYDYDYVDYDDDW